MLMNDQASIADMSVQQSEKSIVSRATVEALPTRPFDLLDGLPLIQTLVALPRRSFTLAFGRPGVETEPIDCLTSGRIEVFSPELKAGFIVVRTPAGRTFFGREKFKYPLFSTSEALGGYHLFHTFDNALKAAANGMELLNTLASTQETRHGGGQSPQTPTRRARLEQFVARLQGLGYPASLDEQGADAQVCGAIAGIFAREVNGGCLMPTASFSDHDRAVMWVGAVATDVATQVTGASFELAGLLMPVPLVTLSGVSAENVERIGRYISDAVAEAFEVHNRLTRSGAANETAMAIAKCFMDWAVNGDDEGLLAIRKGLPQLSVNIAVTL